ncbi:SUR7/PalI family protein [Mycobacterium sp. HUMS_1102779]|uniref:hypothetical protein n=1 Tax=Mycobacterium sp. HUMS_1102779 TaxID=3383487 RepID=UPI00389A1D40
MLIIALVLALIGLVALVFAVVTSNELVAWVCIGASVLGVVLLIIDALRERQQRGAGEEQQGEEPAADDAAAYVDYPEEAADERPAADANVTESFEEAATEAGVPGDGRRDDPAK